VLFLGLCQDKANLVTGLHFTLFIPKNSFASVSDKLNYIDVVEYAPSLLLPRTEMHRFPVREEMSINI
jgi:hypothetical protein